MRIRNLVLIVITTLLLSLPVWAEDESQGQNSSQGGIHLRGWGIRAGLGVDPDQLIVGAHWDLGEIVEHLRLQPNVELGFGDDVLTLFG